MEPQGTEENGSQTSTEQGSEGGSTEGNPTGGGGACVGEACAADASAGGGTPGEGVDAGGEGGEDASVSELEVCEQPKEPGPCRGAIPAFWYNSATGECEPFTYGGCQGNDNRFASADECRDTCGGTLLTCDELAAEAQQILDTVQACTDADTCDSSFLGSGCSDGLLPVCGFGHVEGADLTRLTNLDREYRDRECVTGPIACADCAGPTSVECQSGTCTPVY